MLRLDKAFVGAVLTIAMSCAIIACQTTPTDVLMVSCDRTQTDWEAHCAKSVVDMYTNIYQQRALEAMQNQSISDDVKTKIADTNAAVSPVVLELNDANRTYLQIETLVSKRPDLTTSADEQLVAQRQKVADLVNLALPKLNYLVRLIGGAK